MPRRGYRARGDHLRDEVLLLDRIRILGSQTIEHILTLTLTLTLP